MRLHYIGYRFYQPIRLLQKNFLQGSTVMEDTSIKNCITPRNFDEEEYTLRKRLPKKYPKRKNDVYVTRESNFSSQVSRCQSLLEAGYQEIYIHGLGAAINRCMNLALQLQTLYNGTLNIDCNTSTVELTDDLIPEKDNLAPDTLSRNNSAIHVKLTKITVDHSDEKNPSKTNGEI